MNLSNQAHSFPDLHQKFLSGLLRWLLQQRRLVRRLTAAWAARRQHAQAMAELYRFTDRELRDLALSRSDVLAIEKGEFRRD
ncbi:MAG: DUF1127 domain-containing protein [Acetobacteraceae bacterium]|jgi:uncharacterized protein YjiS (DUF1127 family)